MASRIALRAVSILALGAGLLAFAPAASATHYPPGSLCYDCHSVSKSKMVAGTNLIKQSQKTATLGMGTGTVPCLFCHEKNASSAPYSDTRVMRGALDHFDASSLSKHPVPLSSNVNPNNTVLDCVDCHVGITATVVTQGDGTTRVHGRDAATETLSPLATLIGAPTTEALLNQSTCQSAQCHDADGGGVGLGYTAPKRHGFAAGITVNDGSAPTLCTQCHGKHNSYVNASLVVLRDDGTALNYPQGDARYGVTTPVTPEKCGKCHNADDGGVASPYHAAGHGKPAIAAQVPCTGCHSAAVPHPFALTAPTNAMRFAFAQGPGQSQLTGKATYSVCLTCHGTYAGKTHSGLGVGCLDCHEPHGKGVGANLKMVRQQVPADYTEDAGGTVQGTNQGVTGTITFTSLTEHYRTVAGTGVCDNVDCHGGVTRNTAAIQPLASFLTSSKHSGGNIAAAPYDCSSCHLHEDGGGAWRAVESCEKCHGMPPVGNPTTAPGYGSHTEANTPHKRHAAAKTAGGYGYDCRACHQNKADSLTHNTGGWNDATSSWQNQANASYQSIFFDPALNLSVNNTPLPNGTDPKQRATSYDPATKTCSNLYCHSDGRSTAAVGSAQWMTGVSTPDWNAQNLACNACHGTTTAANTLTFGAPDYVGVNSHAKHGLYACAVCHDDTIRDTNPADGWTLVAVDKHVDGRKDVKADGVVATFGTGGATTCSAISCHNGGNANWGATLGCADCHLRTSAQGGDLDDWNLANGTASAVNSDEWTNTGHGRTSAYPSGNPAGNFAGPAGDPRGCAYCHSYLGTAQNPLVAHGVATNPFRLANKSGAGEDNGWNNVCLVCHQVGGAGYDPDGLAVGYASRNGTKNVDENHYGAKHTDATKGGTFCWDCHDPHGDTQHYMVQGGAGVTAVSDGVYGLPVTRRPVTGLDVAAGTPPYSSADLVNASFTGLCQTCHTTANYYNQTTNTALNLHNGADGSRCTTCHMHSKKFTSSCDLCHGYPPTTVGDGFGGPGDTDENYPGGAGAHLAHFKGVGKPATDPNRYDFGCLNGTCHPGDQHNQGAGPVLRANVQVAFAPSWNPQGVFTPNATAAQAACTQLYCHSNGLVENGENVGDEGLGEAGLSGLGEYAENSGKATFYGTTPAKPAVWGGSLDCKGCHGKGAPNYKRMSDGVLDPERPVSLPDYLNSGTQTMKDGDVVYNTTGANTHFIHVYKMPNNSAGSCRCHGNAANQAPAGHLDRRVVIPARNCNQNCHVPGLPNTYVWGAKYGSDTGATSCVFWCHGNYWPYDSPGGRVIAASGSPFAQDKLPKYLQSGHGLPATSAYASGNTGAGLKCSACHQGDDRYTTNGPLVSSYHYERDPIATGYSGPGSLATNPYWLKTAFQNDPNGLCTSCHNGTTAKSASNHSAAGMLAGGYDPQHDAAGVWPT
ncbi:MAG: CxxxxCH/CxxCH domain c-type cytochrome, partial [Deferrisomatales bacterium]